jgi:hypothetical protein
LEPLRFPVDIFNRPALPHIDYRIGSYADIREALLRNLDKTPGLSQWTHRGADDPGIALLEGAAILGDILTFYQELYANEAYLRTAQWRESISDLVRLLGYRLSPGLGGRGTFAFEVKGDAPVTVPQGFPVKAEVTGLSKPADFETTDEIIAYPWLSNFSLYRRLFTPNIEHDTTEFYIFSPDQFVTPIELKAKDRLLVAEADNPSNPTRLFNPEIVIVDSVRDLHGQKIFKIKGSLKRTGSVFRLTAFKLGRSFRHFGNNGPQKVTKQPAEIKSTAVVSGTTTTVTSTPIPELQHSFYRGLDETTVPVDGPYTNVLGIHNLIKFCEPTLGALEFPLDNDIKDLAIGTPLIITLPLFRNSDKNPVGVTLVRTVANVRSATQTYGLVTGNTSIVTLNSQLNVIISGSNYRVTDVRQMLLEEVVSPALEIRGGFKETDAVTDNKLYFFGTQSQALNLSDRRVYVVKPSADPILATVTDVQALSSTVADRPLLHRVTFDRDFTLADFPNEKPTVGVYGNLVDATQGKTEASAPLGNGDSRLVFQTFKLSKGPLTYLISKSATPPEVPELEIYVNDRLWKRVPSFFGRDADEEIYIVREDAENNSWVQFGDGITGARLPSGIKNVVAKYRTGTGAFGELKPQTKVQGGKKLDHLDKIQMPDVAAGGSEPEDGENARDAAPGKIQSLDRLVSLQDFESEALAISGVTKAAATWALVNNNPEVVITVLMDTGREDEIADVRQTLAAYNQGRGPNRFPISVLKGLRRYVVVQATFGYDATYLEADLKAEIQKVLGVNSGVPNAKDDQSGLFSLRQRRFGQREYATSIAGRIQQVEGVTWAEVTRFSSLGALPDPTIFVPPAMPILVFKKVACSPQRVLSLYSGHLQLTGVAEVLPEVKQ